ncbi:MAG: ketopantoate reductase family protein [Planctomycetota bacterium]|jgi:2-dehydropantoate 2-reductase
MEVLVYGGGAVGLGLASCLLKAGAGVDIIARGETVAALRKEGLIRQGIFGEYAAGPEAFGSYESLEEMEEKAYDYILVCVKSFDSGEAARELSGKPGVFGKQTKIVLCQNGWGNAEEFLAFFERERVYSGRVITGFRRFKANGVEITVHADAIHVGSLFGCESECVENLCEAVSKGGIPCEAMEEIGKDLWAKMLYNCALNPLGAILGVPYGVLAESEYTRFIMDGIAEEVFAVMKGAGYETHWGDAEAFLSVFYERLVPVTAEHMSSTLQSIQAGKRTEIDALNGSVMRLAEGQALEVPYNRAVYNIIKFSEGRSGID